MLRKDVPVNLYHSTQKSSSGKIHSDVIFLDANIVCVPNQAQARFACLFLFCGYRWFRMDLLCNTSSESRYSNHQIKNDQNINRILVMIKIKMNNIQARGEIQNYGTFDRKRRCRHQQSHHYHAMMRLLCPFEERNAICELIRVAYRADEAIRRERMRASD